MKKKETTYKAHYNPNRECYISADGKFLCYITTDLDTQRLVTLRYEIGRDGITEELAFQIDALNHSMDLNDRCESDLHDPRFNGKASSKAVSDDEDTVDFWDTLADKSGSAEDIVLAEEEPDDPQTAQR